MSARELFKVHYFSNDSEYRIWRNEWCDTCIHDVNDDCPHITNMMVGIPDPALTEVRLGWYDCSEYTDMEEANAV